MSTSVSSALLRWPFIFVWLGSCGGRLGSGEGQIDDGARRATGGSAGDHSYSNAGAGAKALPAPMAGAGGYAGVSNTAGVTGLLPCEPIIDDMEDGIGRMRRCRDRVGVWYAFNETDGATGSQSPAVTSPGVPILSVEIPGGRGGSKRAMHTNGSSVDYRWWAGIGIDLAYDGIKYGLYDASAYDGVTFWVRGSATPNLQFRASTSATTLPKYGGACSDYFCDPLSVVIDTRSDWHQRWVPFTQLRHYEEPLDRKALTNLQFYCEYGCTSFDFWIDDLAFYSGEPDCCKNPPATCQGEVPLTNTVLGKVLNKSKVSSCEVCTESGLSLSSYGSAIGLGDLTGLSCYANLNSLTVSGWPIDDIGVIADLRELDTVSINSTSLVDARPLGQLPLLRILDLSANQLASSENLSGDWRLTRLNLSKNQLTELAGLSGMRELVALDLSSNRIQKPVGLDTLSKLASLDLSENLVEDLTGISGFKSLTSLDLSKNSLADLTGIGGLTLLTSLDLSNNQLTELAPLASLRSLATLNLKSNQITDLSPLAGLSALTTLILSQNLVVDLTPLAQLSKLTILRLDNNRVQDTRPLLGLTHMTELLLEHNLVTDLGGLAEMTQVSTLSLNDNAIADLRPLAKLSKITTFNLSRNQISDASGLPMNVVQVTLSENQLTSLATLAPLTKLDNLIAEKNQIADLVAIPDFPRLTSLCVSNNMVSNLDPLAKSKLHVFSAVSNQITDLTPLVGLASLNSYSVSAGGISTASGYTSYGSVSVNKNPIDCTSQAENIAALRARSIGIYIDCP